MRNFITGRGERNKIIQTRIYYIYKIIYLENEEKEKQNWGAKLRSYNIIYLFYMLTIINFYWAFRKKTIYLYNVDIRSQQTKKRNE